MAIQHLKDPDGWQECQDNNTDPYGNACIMVARRVMEILDNGEPFDCDAIISQADKESGAGGITGFMAGAVASIVSNVHVRGDDFRRQWNLAIQINDEGEKANKSGGILNPALLNIRETIGGAK